MDTTERRKKKKRERKTESWQSCAQCSFVVSSLGQLVVAAKAKLLVADTDRVLAVGAEDPPVNPD